MQRNIQFAELVRKLTGILAFSPFLVAIESQRHSVPSIAPPPITVKIVFATRRAETYEVFDWIQGVNSQEDTGWKRTECVLDSLGNRHQFQYYRQLVITAQSW